MAASDPQQTQVLQRLQRILSSFSSSERIDLVEAIQVGATGGGFGIPSENNIASNWVVIASKEDFPTPLNGVIQLEDNKTYLLAGTVDLEGLRLVGGRNTSFLGGSSENSRIKSTGLVGSPLISSEWSLPMRALALEAHTVLNLDANGNSDQALDWFGVNFVDCSNIGRIANYNNVIFQTCGILNSQGLEFDGTIGTIGFSQTIFDCSPGGTIITLPATLTVSRRFRIIYSAFVILSGETGIDASTSATIPVDGYILDTVNFSGGGTYTTGVTFSDNKTLFVNNKGISNSATTSYYTMNGNATATVIANTNTPVKVAGTTTSQPATQKFTNTDNRATFTGEVPGTFKVTGVLSCTSGNNNQVGVYVAKNGTVINFTESYVTTSGAGRAENALVQAVVDLTTNDFVEIFVENNTATNNITVTDLSVIIEVLR